MHGRKRISQKARHHQAPGTLIYTGEKHVDKVSISLLRYDEASAEELSFNTIEDCLAAIDNSKKNWIDIEGLHDVKNVELIGKRFNLHPLLQEDVLNINQRPKIDDYENLGNLFIVSTMLFPAGAKNAEIISEQVSFVLTKNTLITFQEKPGDVFDSVRDRLRKTGSRVRQKGVDYLCYALLDSIVDTYFILLENIGSELERTEEQLLDYKSSKITLKEIYGLKQQMLQIKNAVLPLREMFSSIVREEFDLFDTSTLVFVRDLFDHSIRVMEQTENFRESVIGLYDMYIANVNQRLNEVIKMLTIISTIFIPLTFVVGIYGMNFDNMPELHSQNGYFVVMGLMVALVILMVVYFKRKRWF